MIRQFKSFVAALVLVAASVPVVVAQQAAAPKDPVDSIAFKVTVVITRWSGEKRVSSVPFTLFVPSGERSSVRMGGQVPVPQVVANTSKEGTQPVIGAQYQNIGTNVDVASHAVPPQSGRYRFKVTVTDTQVALSTPSNAPGESPILRAMPTYQNFSSDTWLLIRDGETMQYTTATDKITGEVTKIDVTLNVVK